MDLRTVRLFPVVVWVPSLLRSLINRISTQTKDLQKYNRTLTDPITLIWPDLDPGLGLSWIRLMTVDKIHTENRSTQTQ